MPDIISVPSQNVLPVWDSFEATFFVLSGMSVGFVFGYLFPSIWRTIRRRFRPHRRYALSDIKWEKNLDFNINLFELESGEKLYSDYTVIELFVIARNFVQKKEFRFAIKMYGDVLTSTRATTGDIYRAMFELAQVYFSLELYTRAFDTAFELLKRKPYDAIILKFVLDILDRYFDENKINQVFRTYKGNLNEQLKRQMSFLACRYTEQYLSTNSNIQKAISMGKFAHKIYADSAYAQVLLWQALSLRTRHKKILDIKSQWIAFGGDLSTFVSICRKYQTSVSSGSSYLCKSFLTLYTEDRDLTQFDNIKNEFNDHLNLHSMNVQQKKIFLHILLEMYFIGKNTLEEEKHVTYQWFILKIFECDVNISKAFEIFFSFSKENIFVNKILNPDLIPIGLQTHQCKDCKSIFTQFKWSCEVCGSFESLKNYLLPFTEYAFNEQNWHPHKDNRNRCAHSHSCT